MVTTKQLNVKNRTYYFYNDLMNLKDFYLSLPKLDKSHSATFLCIILDMSQKSLSTVLTV